MPDFTFDTYEELIRSVLRLEVPVKTFAEVMEDPSSDFIVFRHDVDLKPGNSLRIAQILNRLGVKGTFYFRIVPQSYHVKIIRSIADLGHEIGYHYEDLTLAKGNINQAKELFEKHLSMLREHAQIETICMHGSPLSKHDNRDIWKTYDYKDYGLLGEPYHDIDFSKVLYLTDTGRRWDNKAVSVRDKVPSDFGRSYSSTYDIIHKIDELPSKVMFTTHPQRWNNNMFLWTKELIFQSLKNKIKQYFFVKDTDEY